MKNSSTSRSIYSKFVEYLNLHLVPSPEKQHPRGALKSSGNLKEENCMETVKKNVSGIAKKSSLLYFSWSFFLNLVLPREMRKRNLFFFVGRSMWISTKLTYLLYTQNPWLHFQVEFFLLLVCVVLVWVKFEIKFSSVFKFEIGRFY